jgi:hypothetical protein
MKRSNKKNVKNKNVKNVKSWSDWSDKNSKEIELLEANAIESLCTYFDLDQEELSELVRFQKSESRMFSAFKNVKHQEEAQLYKKLPDGTYQQVGTYESANYMREGYYLVKVCPNGTQIRSAVFPQTVEVEAALMEVEEKLTTFIMEAAKAKPHNYKMTPKEAAAWETFIKKWGDAYRYISYGSANDIAQRIIGDIRKKIVSKNGGLIT